MTDGARTAALGALLAVVTAGCTATAPELEQPTQEVPFVLPPTPGTPEQTFEVLPPPPPVAWSGDGRRLTVVTYGSSSCPTGPADVDVVGHQEVRVEIEELFPGRDPCTADMAVRSDEVDVPADISPDEPVTVHLRYDDGSEQTVVVPPAG